jgi:F-type H+-transporting ATPase subunit b
VDNPLVQVDPGLYVWTILTFLVLAALLAKFAWRPLLHALELRRKSIADALEEARKAREELARVQEEGAQLLVEARREADAIVSAARADAERFRQEMRQQATDQAAGIVERAQREIERQTAQAVAQLRQEAVDLSFAIASKVLRRTVTPADHERLLDEVITTLDQERPDQRPS